MDYISAKEAAARWGVDTSQIGKLARKGRIEGAKIVGRNWLIPANATKPIDARTKPIKAASSQTAFRFPLYVNFSANDFTPPLSHEESVLRQAQVAFYACEFDRAKAILESLSQSAESIYVKICALFYMSVLSVIHSKHNRLKQYYGAMVNLLSKDFPHKREMNLFLPFFDCCIGKFYDIPKKLCGESMHSYHGSAVYMSVFLSFFNISAGKPERVNPLSLEPYVTLCELAERDGYYVEAQKLHIFLFLSYYAIHNTSEMQYHIKSAIDIAYRHNLIYSVADAMGYYYDEFDRLLSDYPEAFTEKIRTMAGLIAGDFAIFSKKNDMPMYSKLSSGDYRFLIYALKRYSNRQVADICGTSERSVATKYNIIYNKLGVNGKKELLEEIEREMENFKEQ